MKRFKFVFFALLFSLAWAAPSRIDSLIKRASEPNKEVLLELKTQISRLEDKMDEINAF